MDLQLPLVEICRLTERSMQLRDDIKKVGPQLCDRDPQSNKSTLSGQQHTGITLDSDHYCSGPISRLQYPLLE